MINSAEEFKRLRESLVEEEYHRAAHDEASEAVWYDVIEKYPEMKTWVVHNKTVPLSILDFLAGDPNPDIRSDVARKRKLSRDLFVLLSNDSNVSVLFALANNPKIPRDIFHNLANTSDEWLQEQLVEIKNKKPHLT